MSKNIYARYFGKLLLGFAVFFYTFCGDLAFAQSVLVNQGVVSIAGSTTLSVAGSVQNNAGATMDLAALTSAAEITTDVTNNGIINDRGTITLNGNWYNNLTFSCYTGTVRFNGVNQLISGSTFTLFYNLNLDNSGIKTQTIDAVTSGTLNLNSVELATGAFNMYVSNGASAAVQRVSGFVSSTSGGSFGRATNSTSTYLFPVGSSTGTTRYRPVEIVPVAANANVFEVRLANVNPTSEGYNVANKEAIVCAVNPLFYHVVNHSFGADNVALSTFYDNTADGSWDAMGNWLTVPSAQWYEIAGSSTAVGAPLYKATANNQSLPASDLPIALTKHSLTVDLGVDATLCLGDNMVLDAGNPGSSYNWTGGSSGQTLTVSTTNTYFVTVTNAVNGCQTIDDILVTFTSSADASITAAGPFCEDEAAANLSAVTAGGNWSGIGITNSTNGTFDPTTAGVGTFTITYGISGSCGDTATIDITVLERADATISPAGPFCSSEAATDLNAADLGGSWSGTGITNPSNGTFDPSVVGAGSYPVTYTISGQCGDSDTETIVVIDQLDATITAVGPYCDNEPSITLVANDAGGVWSGTGITSATTGTFDPATASAGSHDVVYTISGACGDIDTLTINVNETPNILVGVSGESCSGAADGQAWVDVSGGTSPYTILWDNSSSTDSINQLLPGAYGVTVSDMNGCTRASTGIVDASSDSCYIPHVYIPNIFSPNGDANNDIYFVQGKGIESITIRIFDRWGEKVFETMDMTVGWNGEFNGKPVEEGAYPYVISLLFDNEVEARIYNGYISIVR